jgi:hypothetical protein
VSHSGAVVIAIGYPTLRVDNQVVGFWLPVVSRTLTSSYCPDWLWSSHSLLSNAYQGLFPWGVKCQGCEADHSPPASSEVKKTLIYTSTPTCHHSIMRTQLSIQTAIFYVKDNGMKGHLKCTGRRGNPEGNRPLWRHNKSRKIILKWRYGVVVRTDW